MERLKRHWYQVPRSVRLPVVFIVGSVIILAGAIMWFIPGPGWATVLLGLVILSTEFTWAERLRRSIIGRFKNAAEAIKSRAKR